MISYCVILCTKEFFVAATVVRDEVGLSLDKADKAVLGTAAKVVLTKDATTIVGDGSTQEAVTKRVAQIRNLIEVGTLQNCAQSYVYFLQSIATAICCNETS